MAEVTRAFTTWRAFYWQIQDDLASGAYTRVQSYSVTSGGAGGSRSVSYRGLQETLSMLEYADMKAREEELGPYPGRTYAVNGGRGDGRGGCGGLG
jgi:hypothetical protein